MRESNSITSSSRLSYLVGLFAVTALLIAPLWTVETLPLIDLPDHLARAFILHTYDQVPIFQQYYEIQDSLLPNLALDLIVPGLLNWFDAYTAAKLFVSLLVALFVTGCHALGREIHGAPTWAAIPTAFFFYNWLLLYGMVNYAASLALFMIAAAIWLRFSKSLTLFWGTAATLVACATYVAHLSGFVFLCVFAGMWTLAQVVEQRKVSGMHLLPLLPLLPGLAGYATLQKGDVSQIEWATPVEKVAHFWTLFAGYATWTEVGMLAGLLAVAALLYRYGTVTIIRPAAFAAAGLGLAFLLLPRDLLTGTDADTRFLPAAASVAVLAAVVRMPNRMARLTYGLVLVLFIGRIGAMTWYWQKADALGVEQRGLLRKLPEGSRLFSLVFRPAHRSDRKIVQPLAHLSGYATIDRQVIAGSTFTVKGQQPLQRRIPLWFHDVNPGVSLQYFNWVAILANYDHIWAYSLPTDFADYLRQHCDLIAQSGKGELYGIRRPPLR